jgi:DNA-binding LacI/PurR family transcriptional regulator
MQMMLALLDGEKPENQIVPAELVVRQTTALFGKNLEAAG